MSITAMEAVVGTVAVAARYMVGEASVYMVEETWQR